MRLTLLSLVLPLLFAGCSRTGLFAEDRCGDGFLEPEFEACDDGEANSDLLADACRTTCELPWCGDGVVDTDEECDDGNTIDDDACSNACRAPAIPCYPCETDDECGRGVDLCVPHPDGGGCGVLCESTTCPEDYHCEAFGGSMQCVPDAEVCTGCFDRDGDGYGVGWTCIDWDCNDNNAEIHPGAVEICDDLDNDCDSENDEVCPPDLFLLDGEVVELWGDHLYDHVMLDNDALIRIGAFEDYADGGCLRIDARVVHIREGSGIDGVGRGGGGEGEGESAGTAPPYRANSSPSGGGYGGRGGTAGDLRPGQTYGSRMGRTIEQGSNGGWYFANAGLPGGSACDDTVGLDSEGGTGGACLQIRTYQPIYIDGFVRVDGSPGTDGGSGEGPYHVDGGGGGSGGGVLLEAPRVELGASSFVGARGGNGGVGTIYDPGYVDADGNSEYCFGHGGSGGGGGRIKIYAESFVSQGRITTAGGTGARHGNDDRSGLGIAGEDGESGTTFTP